MLLTKEVLRTIITCAHPSYLHDAGLKNGADIYRPYLSGLKISSTRVPPASILFFRSFQSMLLNASQLFKLCRMGNGFQKCDSYTLWRHHCSTTETFKGFQIQVITKSGILGCPNPTKIVSLARAHDSSETLGPITGASQNRATSHTGQAGMEGETVSENKFQPPRTKKRKRKHFADPVVQ